MKEAIPSRPRLRVAVALDYPAASEILVSFPEKWELVHILKREGIASPLYIAAFPQSQEKPSRDRFYGLSPEINLSLTTYRLYKFFEPWSMPSVFVDWNEAAGQGQVVGRGDLKVQLQPLGQAQAWFGQDFGVLWECYFHQTERGGYNWQARLAEIWRVVEKDIGVGKVFTQPQDPAFTEGYTDFLSRLGYAPDPESPQWWSKAIL